MKFFNKILLLNRIEYANIGI